MNIKRILCPVDFSEFNHSANEYASVLAKATGARIIYFHTISPENISGVDSEVFGKTDEERDLTRLEEHKPTIDGVEASYVIEFGTPADRILKYARDNEIDLIVLATHGRSGFSRLLMGSVADVVVRKGTCPVLAVKSDSKIRQKN